MRKANIRWSWDPDDVEPAALMALYDAAGFSSIDPGDTTPVAGLFGPGAFGLFAFSANMLIGAARTFSDDLTTMWLAEIGVNPGWRARGIGRALLERIDERFGRTALYCDAPRETVDFFTTMGIRPKTKLNVCRRLRSGRTCARENPGAALHDDASRYGPRDFDDVADSVGFGIHGRGMPRDRLYRRLFGNGIFGVFAENLDGRLIGFLRIFSDDLTKSYVAEICVHPKWQRQGIGRALVGRAVRRFSHTAIYTEAFPGAIRLFETCGVAPAADLIGCSRAPLKH